MKRPVLRVAGLGTLTALMTVMLALPAQAHDNRRHNGNCNNRNTSWFRPSNTYRYQANRNRWLAPRVGFYNNNRRNWRPVVVRNSWQNRPILVVRR